MIPTENERCEKETRMDESGRTDTRKISLKGGNQEMRYQEADDFPGSAGEGQSYRGKREETDGGMEIQLRTEYQQRGGEQKLHMRFARSAVSDYENHVILENMCPVFLDMYTARNGADLDIYYRMTGYIGLKKYIRSRRFSGSEILKIVVELMEAVKSCEEYLIFPEYISLRADHIFISGDDGTLRLMYLPGYRTTKALKKLIVSLIDELSAADFREEADRNLILGYRSKVLADEYGIQGCINLAEDMMRGKIRNESGSHFCDSAASTEMNAIDKVRETESQYFDSRITGLINMKKKLADFMENLLS